MPDGKQETIETYPEGVVLQQLYLVPRRNPLELLLTSEEIAVPKSYVAVSPAQEHSPL